MRFRTFSNRTQCAFIERRNSPLARCPTPCRATTTTSRPESVWRILRKLSRTVRFTRLRSTARRTAFFETARPRRETLPPRHRASTVKHPSRERSALANTQLYSSPESNRAAFGKASVPILDPEGPGRLTTCIRTTVGRGGDGLRFLSAPRATRRSPNPSQPSGRHQRY